MKKLKAFLAYLLCASLIVTALPATALATSSEAQLSSDEVKTIDNGYIKVEVSNDNGGFLVSTVKGDLIKKSDNNKRLLFHNGEYDTSFVSYRVEYEGGKIEDYIFGGKYGGLTDASRKGVSVTQGQANGDIVATWGTGDLEFTQTITLANDVSPEHGMVSISLSVRNKGNTPVEVKARLLLDTCLDGEDYGYYQVLGDNNTTNQITEETVVPTTNIKTMPQNFYAVDDPANPGITAYSVSATDQLPYQVAFGHWNNLAASLFDFTPTPLDFTKDQNDYMTADSAYALYYDMGSVVGSSSSSLVSYYGVYSRSTVSVDQNVAIDTTSPLKLDLNSTKDGFVRLSDVGAADFSVSVNYENLNVTGAKAYSKVWLVVQSTSNLKSLNDKGEAVSGQDFDTAGYFTAASPTDFTVGKKLDKQLYFKARLTDSASYERITISVYDVSNTNAISEENRLGTKNIYVLLPGKDGNIPKVAITSMNPNVIYYAGTRHLFLTATNASMLDNRSAWNLVAYTSDKKTRIEIPHDNITIKNGVMDVVLDSTMNTSPGSWFLQLEWTQAAVNAGLVSDASEKHTSSQMEFVVSTNTKYRNDSYGILAVVKRAYESSSKGSEYEIKSFVDESKYEEYVQKEKQSTAYKFSVLMEFKGSFIQNEYKTNTGGEKVGTYYTAVSSKVLDTSTREYTVENCVNINDCIDFEGGTLTVYYEDYQDENKTLDQCKDSAICVEFDGELLTSEARTPIWTGKAAFTKLEQGNDYSLRPYDKDGNRKDESTFNDETITLIWPSPYAAAQTLSGLVFKMAYGELGVMLNDDGTELGRVLSFTAQLDLSFTGTVSEEDGGEQTTTFMSKLNEIWSKYEEGKSVYYYYDGNTKDSAFSFDLIDEEKAAEDEKAVNASVMVQDILFGCGKGFVGVHFKVGVGLQNYISGLSKISGTLEVNTINNWTLGLEGNMKLASCKLEAKLKFKAKDDVPVPDDIYFYVGGFDPGINIDGFGVVWITGGGGGISNLYDTIYGSNDIPPLKLILKVSFSLLATLDADATITASASNLTLKAENIGILIGYKNIEFLDSLSLSLTWLPKINISAAMQVDFQKIIVGGGYIVLTNDTASGWFFEMYARAELLIPESIPLIGGVTIGGADVGMNTEKVWGGINAFSVDVGMTYYWGESSPDFYTGGSSKAKPTYPELLSLNGLNENGDVPVYYDEKTDKMLYAHMGTNFSEPQLADAIADDGSVVEMNAKASAENEEGAVDALKLMDAGNLKTAASYKLHKFNLGTYSADNSAAMVQIDYDATSLEDAKTKAKSFVIKDVYDKASKALTGDAFPITLYDKTAKNTSTANANITYNASTKKATFAFTVTDPNHYNKDWYISSGDIRTNVSFYNVKSLPKMTGIKVEKDTNNDPQIVYTGSKLDELDYISFYFTETTKPTEAGYAIGSCYSAQAAGGTLSLKDMLIDLPSGEYYLKAVYSKEGELNSVIYSTNKFTYTNPNNPKDITASEVTGFGSAGNLTLGATIADPGDRANVDGYLVTVYDESGKATDISDMKFERTSGKSTYVRVGGSYDSSSGRVENGATVTETVAAYKGLTAGKQYKLGITPYKLIDSSWDNDKNAYVEDGEYDYIIRGKEYITGLTTLAEMTPPTVSIAADKTGNKLKTKTGAVGTEAGADEIMTFGADELTFTVSAGSDKITGKWSLDSAKETDKDASGALLSTKGYYGEFTSQSSFKISLKNLDDGRHTLTVTGKDEHGDTFKETYAFAVDTEAPRLMIKSPVKGSLFDINGSLEIAGVTDTDALITVKAGGTVLVDKKLVSQISGATLKSDGSFSFGVKVPNASTSSEADITIMAEDAIGNKTDVTVRVVNGSVRDLASVILKADGVTLTDGNIAGSASSTLTKQLTLVGKTAAGKEFALDEDYIIWECKAVEGSASVSADGKLTIGPAAQGIVTGKYEVSGGAYMTYTLCFGAEITNNFVYTGVISGQTSGKGGSVSGGGYYRQGETVTLSATADLGYTFAKWNVVEGSATLSTTSNAQTSFTMPGGNVLLQAEYNWTGLPKETTPNATFTATGADSGKLTNVVTGMKYSIDSGDTWKSVTDANITSGGVDLTGITSANGVRVKKLGNGTTTSDSDVQTITVTKAEKPQSLKGENCTSAKNNNGKITGVSNKMQYKAAEGTVWTDCTGETVEGLAAGNYLVRMKPDGSSLASETSTVTIGEYVPSGGGGSKQAVATEIESLNASKGELVIVDPATGKAIKKAAFSDGKEETVVKDNKKLTVQSGDIPYYLDDDGKRVYVPFSAEKDGKIVFLAPKDTTYYFAKNEVPFTDTEGYWAESQVSFTASREIFSGIGEDRFGPKESMTRAMFVTVLWRMAGKPDATDSTASSAATGGSSATEAVSAAKSFTDVKTGSWYEDAVAWASANGIVNGMSETSFAPDAHVTREQMCSLLARFLTYEGISLAETAEASDFTDKSSIGAWALSDVEFCQTAGLISGYPDGTFKPKGDATRAENAAVFERMINTVIDQMSAGQLKEAE